MNLIQTFESTVASKSSIHTGHFVVVPKRSLPENYSNLIENEIFDKLAVKQIGLVSASNLGRCLAVLLSPNISEHERIRYLNAELNNSPVAEIINDDKEFGEYMAFERMVPFENSPLDLESLSKIVLQATGAGLGAYAGFILAGPTPLLFVTAPAGMILFGAAKGIADALEQGLRERLLNYLRPGIAVSSGVKKGKNK